MEPCRSGMVRTWWAGTTKRARRNRKGKAVEKPGPWKPWKTKKRFPTVPTALRNPIAGFPLSHRLGDDYPCSTEPKTPIRKPPRGLRANCMKPDRSCVNKTGQVDISRTVLKFSCQRHVRMSYLCHLK